jgi:YD repeat-containing protein
MDAEDREIVLRHDALGRVIRRIDPDGTTSWTWDTAAYGVGKRAEVKSPDGHKVSYRYDFFGRLQTTELLLDNEVFASNITYDAFGRPETITYPQGAGVAPFAVKRQYDTYGHLLAVRDAATNAPYWELWGADSAGRTTEELLAQVAVDLGPLSHARVVVSDLV